MSQIKYYFMNHALVDPDVAMKHREIISENVTNAPGDIKLFTLTFKQVLQDFSVRNWNGRVYRPDIVVNALDKNPLVQHDIRMKTWTGEYGHPQIVKGMNEVARQMTIYPPNACWTINKYWVEGNLLMGECTTLAGGYGDMVRDRILTNYPAMASSRALGGCDPQGNVLPGYTVVTFDCVIRPSHKVAYMDQDTVKVNAFPISTGQTNTMSESVILYDPKHDASLKDYLLSENSSKQQISMLCDTLKLDYDSIQIDGKNMKIQQINENGYNTIVIPLNQMVNAEYYNLF